MTAAEFNTLIENERTAIVWEEGVLIEERMGDEHLVKIYSMKGFFVEVWMDNKKMKVQKVQALEDETEWSSYLDDLEF